MAPVQVWRWIDKSPNMTHSWPSKSPELSPPRPLVGWGTLVLRTLSRHPPKLLEELKKTVEEFASSLDKKKVLTSAR